jgi:CRISPR-associated protein Csb1
VTALDLDNLVAACSPGGATCLTSTTDLEPAGGPHTAVAPAKFAAARGTEGAYAYEKRFLDGEARWAVLIDSKQSQLNRVEQALAAAVEDGVQTLENLPRVTVTYDRDGATEVYSDLTLPHRIYDGHIRAGSVDGKPVTEHERYRAVRNSTPADARALLEASPVTLVLGGWDSSRKSRQGRWRSALVGEIIGFCADQGPDAPVPGRKGGARVDPVGMQVLLPAAAMKRLVDSQRDELSTKTYDKAVADRPKKGAAGVSASSVGLGGIPPSLSALAGVACDRIIRSHVLSFAALRQIRFGAGPNGDAACRAVLAALALSGLARADAELNLRANCDLVESGPTRVWLDQRGGKKLALDPLTPAQADALLAAALDRAGELASLQWRGVVLAVTGNAEIIAGAVADDTTETAQ